MSLTLILMRHAKSDWTRAMPDHDRPLNPRGRDAATRLGNWLRAEGLEPAQILCSTSLRTRETCAGLELPVAPELTPSLYDAEPSALLHAIQGAGASPLLMIAHNPSIAAMAEIMCSAPPEDSDFERYPTGATTVLAFDAPSWADLRPGTGRLVHFVVPRALPAP